MAIGPDGRIIRRHIRQFTPVNTDQPQEDIGFFMGYFAVMIVSVIVILLFVFMGWIGGLFFNLSWWTTNNLGMAGFVINMILFPVYISGALEGLAHSRPGRFRVYSFIYGAFSLSILIAVSQLSQSGWNAWTYLWAVGYGFYTVWLAAKMSG
jgi:hypothetical protein